MIETLHNSEELECCLPRAEVVGSSPTGEAIFLHADFTNVKLVGESNLRAGRHSVKDSMFTLEDYVFFESASGLRKSSSLINRRHGKFHFIINCATQRNISIPSLIKEGMVNVILTNNATHPLRWMPMTGWILYHRVVHILSLRRDLFTKPLERIKATRLPFEVGHKLDLASGVTFDQQASSYLKSIMTMRSARLDNLQDVDIFAELFAQFMVTGKITFSRDSLLEDEFNSIMAEFVDSIQPGTYMF